MPSVPRQSDQSSDLSTECDRRPRGTVTLGVRGSAEEKRSWLSGSPVVPALAALGIAHAGVITASEPYRIVRTKLSGAYFMATLAGAGRVYLNGSWATCRSGQAVLLMPGAVNAFHAVKGAPWSHCWVRIAAGADVLKGPVERMQVITKWPAGPLRHAVLGLREAALAAAAPALQQRWAELVLHSLGGFRESHAPDPRIARLWEAVDKTPAQPWDLAEMARIAALSPEHLRRLCRLATGRAPHAHLMHLRMKRAAELLVTTNWTLERIAEAVGYASAFAFSAAFKKVIGWPPSTYVQRARR